MVDVLNKILLIFNFLAFICQQSCSYEMGELTDVSPPHSCTPNPCKNVGICHVDSQDKHDFQCACQLGFRGKVCNETTKHCDGLLCQETRDCLSTPVGAVCICVGSISGRLCHMSVHKPNPWDEMVYVLSGDSQRQVEAFLGVIIIVILVIAIGLLIHCCRVARKRRNILEEYKKNLKRGKVPKDLPPDWFDVSSSLCKQSLCCKSGTSQEKRVHSEKSDSKLNSKSKSRVNDLAQREDEFDRLMTSRSDLNIIKNRASRRLKRHASGVSSRETIIKNKTNHSTSRHYDLDKDCSDSMGSEHTENYIMNVDNDHYSIVNESLDGYETGQAVRDRYSGNSQKQRYSGNRLKQRYSGNSQKQRYEDDYHDYRDGLNMKNSNESETEEEYNRINLELNPGEDYIRRSQGKFTEDRHRNLPKEYSETGAQYIDEMRNEEYNSSGIVTEEDVPLLPRKPTEKRRKYRAYSYTEEPHYIEFSCDEASERDFYKYSQNEKSPMNSIKEERKVGPRANVNFSSSGKYRRYMMSKVAPAIVGVDYSQISKNPKPRSLLKMKRRKADNKQHRTGHLCNGSRPETLHLSGHRSNSYDIRYNKTRNMPKKATHIRTDKNQNCYVADQHLKNRNEICDRHAPFDVQLDSHKRMRPHTGIHFQDKSIERDFKNTEDIANKTRDAFIAEPTGMSNMTGKTLHVSEDVNTSMNSPPEYSSACELQNVISIVKESDDGGSEGGTVFHCKGKNCYEHSLRDIANHCKSWLEQSDVLLSDLPERPAVSRSARHVDASVESASACTLVSPSLNTFPAKADATYLEDGDTTIQAPDESDTDCSEVTLKAHPDSSSD